MSTPKLNPALNQQVFDFPNHESDKYFEVGFNISIEKSISDYIWGKLNTKPDDVSALGTSTPPCAPYVRGERAAPHAPLDACLSFRGQLTGLQSKVLKTILTYFSIGWLLVPSMMLRAGTAALFFVFFLIIAWRSTILFCGWVIAETQTSPAVLSAQDKDLPIYSILVPAYREHDLMPQIARAMRALDWPAHRLDILILLEEDDAETIAAAETAAFPDGTRICRVPRIGPRTKPNALNYGLTLAKGEFVTVYDVEDLPAPNQLRHAYSTFSRSNPNVVCLQAALIGDNARRNWLSAQWALEYDIQFRLLLPGLSLYQMPLPLGGTSNHFRKDALLALGGWDAWNVTEDADLGMRLARASLVAQTFASETYEDAPTQARIWLPQRSRWIKGHIQTWLVLMRDPRRALQQMGFVAFLSAQFSLGASILAPLFHAPCFLFVLATFLIPGLELGRAGGFLLGAGLALGLFSGLAAPGRWSVIRVFAILTQPLYWPLHSCAAYLAIWELVKDPFFWAKTPHRPRAKESPEHCSTGSSASASPPA